MASVHSDLLDVVVIGGGWSGILVCKYAKEHGLKVAVLEQRESIGGVWCFSENPAVTTVMKTTKTSSSATTTEMSDFPMPDEIGEFPKHDDIYKYLNSYVEHFKLKDNFRFNCKVKHVRKYDTSWNTEVEGGQIYRSKNIAVCSGKHIGQVDVCMWGKDRVVKRLFTTSIKALSIKLYCVPSFQLHFAFLHFQSKDYKTN